LFVCLSACLSVVSNGRHKMLGSNNKYTKFGQLISRKILTITATTRCHILRLKCTKFDFWSPSVCLFVFMFVSSVLHWVWHFSACL